MRNAIIFGCGKVGRSCRDLIYEEYESICFTDNNSELWGKTVYGLEVIPPADICEKALSDIFIAIENREVSREILKQINDYGFKNECIYVYKVPFFYKYDRMSPFKREHIRPFHLNRFEKNVLFVASTAGIRDHKIARIIRNSGWGVYLAYFVSHPKDTLPTYVDAYEEIQQVGSIDELYEIVRNSEFDVIHCSSEPEFVTGILSKTGKVVVHDCHDFSSITREKITMNGIMVEYLSHSMADGVIYPSEGLRNEGIRRFGLKKDNTLVIGGFITRDLVPSKRLEKLSKTDGKIHFVYEGLISEGPVYNKKYIVDIWKKITEAGIQLHFYTSYRPDYCKSLEERIPGLHYEGNCNSGELAIEMSKYDVGLCVLNDNFLTHVYLEYSSPLKLFEYLNAGIPVAVGDIKEHREILESDNIGRYIDLNGDIYNQALEISKLRVPDNYLSDHHLYLDEKAEEIIAFYDRLIKKKAIEF